MKNHNLSLRLAVAVVCIAAGVFTTAAVTFTTNTNIAYNNTNFDGLPVVITNCTVTVDGPHVFADVHILYGGVLTHSSTPGGVFTNILSITNEFQVFSSTN